MKKAYTLDYSIQRDCDRVTAVSDILDKMAYDPSQTDLEQMASYILYGKDENGLNAVQRGETTDGNTRYNSFKRKIDKAQSLEELLENPTTDEQTLKPKDFKDRYLQKKRGIQRPKYDKKTGEIIDRGDMDIPFMQDLWESIDRIDRWIAQLEGRIAPDPDTVLFDDSYRLYRLKHNLIEMRRHQYYLKDVYKPTIHFLAVDHPKTQFYDWTGDAYYWMPYDKWKERISKSYFVVSKDLKDYETRGSMEKGNLEVKWVIRQHTFDWFNYKHVRAIMNLYSDLDRQLHEKLDTYGRTLLWDFDRYVSLTPFTDLRLYLIDCKKAGMDYAEILDALQTYWNISYNRNHLSAIYAVEIPKKIVETVRKQQLLCDIPKTEWKQCYTCGESFPRHTLFFGKNSGRKDGWSSNCKDCERKRRIAKGGQGINDRRAKDAQVREV